MAKLDQRMKEILNKQKIVVLATATSEGVPNSVPVGAKRIIDDETIIISDQYFNKTLQNIKANPLVSIAFWDGAEGYQVKGRVSLETSGERFVETAKWIDLKGKAIKKPLKSKGAAIIKIDEIYYVTPGPKAGEKVKSAYYLGP